jgi:flagellar basal-body rod protein FlgC
MDLDVINTAASALMAERLRMDTIASNLANINTTRGTDGTIQPYRRKTVNFQAILDDKQGVQGVTVNKIAEDQSELRAVYDPGHPDADEKGYVMYPNVTTEREMVDMISAKASYEANTKAIQIFKSMYNAALDI